MARFERIAAVALVLTFAGNVWAGSSYPRRHGNAQNTSNVGHDPALTAENAADLQVVRVIDTPGLVNATPVISDGLIFLGESTNHFHVIDTATGKTLVTLLAGNELAPGAVYSYAGIQSTAHVATITVPGENGAIEQRRVYIGAYGAEQTLWCLNVDQILAERAALLEAPANGANYVCPNFPISLTGPGSTNPTYHGTVLISEDQPIRVAGVLETRDVIYAPSTGIDCTNGVLFAIDAATGEKISMWDPVVSGNSTGAVIWFSPAMDRSREHLYVTTGDCVQKPQVGEFAESLIALDPRDISAGPIWFHQRRLVDSSDVDVGNGPTVVDVEGENGCHVVVSTDKDGCIYGFPQARDIPEMDGVGFDALRVGQQRRLWRTCFVVGGIEGGFNAMAASAHDRWAFAQASGNGRYDVTVNVGTDNVHAFLVDACTGEFQWASAAIGWGMGEAAIASGLIFQPSGRDAKAIPDAADLQVVRAGPDYELLATVALPRPATFGGGGPAIVDGAVYVPLREGGVAVVEVVAGSQASPPKDVPVSFAGPYPVPLWWKPEPNVDPNAPY